ncbi:MAG: DUF4469 domain-containing protein [Treponema sp.]|nr:DUF4469 domain-containing protein [Treponema sp.]
MHVTNPIRELFYKIRVLLHPNYLPGTEGSFQARTVNEASLSVDQVCAFLLNRGGFKGEYETLLENVRLYFDEAVYLLCNGMAINTGYFTIYPNIGGTFENARETHDHKKHPVSFRFRTGAKLRRLISQITVSVEGVADTSGWIDEFRHIDTEEEINRIFVPGSMFAVQGSKIKIAGDDPNVGLYFVPVEDPSKAVKAAPIAENTAVKIIGIAPQTGYLRNRIEIRTQYLGSTSFFLKEPRVITSDFILEEA